MNDSTTATKTVVSESKNQKKVYWREIVNLFWTKQSLPKDLKTMIIHKIMDLSHFSPINKIETKFLKVAKFLHEGEKTPREKQKKCSKSR